MVIVLLIILSNLIVGLVSCKVMVKHHTRLDGGLDLRSKVGYILCGYGTAFFTLLVCDKEDFI